MVFPACRTIDRDFYCLSHPVYGNLIRQLELRNIAWSHRMVSAPAVFPSWSSLHVSSWLHPSPSRYAQYCFSQVFSNHSVQNCNTSLSISIFFPCFALLLYILNHLIYYIPYLFFFNFVSPQLNVLSMKARIFTYFVHWTSPSN